MKRLLLGLLFSLWTTLVLAQGCGPTNPNCIVPTAPFGTNNNQAASTAFVQTAGPFVNVTAQPFNADPTGAADSTSAFQNAINSLPVGGGVVLVPIGNYKISSSLLIGNGTTSAVSTRTGVILRGQSNPNTPTALFTGYGTTAGPRLFWTGGGAPVIAIQGPLGGWGLENLYIDCQSVASSIGIAVTSAQNGNNHDLTIANCGGNGILSTTNPLGGYTGVGLVDSWHNSWLNTTIFVPATAAAHGILVTGDAGGTSDTDFNTFTTTTIRLSGNTTNVGLDLQVSDGNIFNNLTIFGGGASSFAIVFDYSANNVFPSGNVISGVDPGATGTQWINSGSPGSTARPNYVYGLSQANSAPNPNIANTLISLPTIFAPTISLTGQTAALGGTTWFTPFATGQYRLCSYLVTTAVGTGGTYNTGFNWNDGVGQSAASTASLTATVANAQANGCLTVHATAGNVVQYFVSFNAVTGSLTYSLYLTAERLN
jgi:Pectate lyase superfamily protein